MSIDFKKAYFAIVSIISVIALAFSGVELIGMAINFLWPQLAEADLQRLREMPSGQDGPPVAYLMQQIRPLNTTIVTSILRFVVFAAVLWWHLPRLLERHED